MGLNGNEAEVVHAVNHTNQSISFPGGLHPSEAPPHMEQAVSSLVHTGPFLSDPIPLASIQLF